MQELKRVERGTISRLWSIVATDLFLNLVDIPTALISKSIKRVTFPLLTLT